MSIGNSPRLLAAGAVLLALVIALVGWYGFVTGQHSKADELDTRIVEEEQKLEVAQLLQRSQAAARSGTTGLGLLEAAMPQSLQMPSVLRQVQSLASSSSVSLETFTPSTGTPLGGYEAVPVTVSVLGRYADVQRFLRGLRTQAGQRGGRIHASGRLFDVQTVSLTPTGEDDSRLNASIRLAVFVYTGQPLAPEAGETGETTPSDDVEVAASQEVAP